MAPNQALQERLHRAGSIPLLTPVGSTTLAYNGRQRPLLLVQEATPRWAPTFERFQEELDRLLRLADINTELNPA